MSDPSSSPVPALTIERQGTITVLTIDDGKANALPADLIAALSAAVSEAEADSATTAIVLVGREGKFSAGFDLKVMQSGDFAAIVNLVTDGGELVHQLYSCSVPIVAACSGHALAAGALILLGCDVRVGMNGPFKIGLNEAAIGMVLPDWALTLAQARIPNTHLQRAVACARLTEASEAITAGFLDAAVEPADLLATAMAEAEFMSTIDRKAYAGTIKIVRSETLTIMRAQIDHDRASVA